MKYDLMLSVLDLGQRCWNVPHSTKFIFKKLNWWYMAPWREFGLEIGEFYYDSTLWILLLWADASYCSVEFIFWNICPYFCPNYLVVHISVLKGHFQWYFGLRDNEEVLQFELLTCPKCLRIEIANPLISKLL